MRLTMFDRPHYFVSLGDSISIDAYAGGPGRGAPSLLFRNRDEEFPGWKGKDLTNGLPGCRMIPLAMDGATAPGVRFVQVPHLLEMGVVPHVVTLTIGGNDLVQAWGNDAAAMEANRNLRENGHAVLTILRKGMTADAPILLGTIYDPTDGTGSAGALQLNTWPRAMNWLHTFNETLRRLAGEHGAILTDIHSHFLGHGAKVGDPTGVESHPENKELWYCGTIEPNAYGANAIRELWWNTLQTSGFLKQEGK